MRLNKGVQYIEIINIYNDKVSLICYRRSHNGFQVLANHSSELCVLVVNGMSVAGSCL